MGEGVEGGDGFDEAGDGEGVADAAWAYDEVESAACGCEGDGKFYEDRTYEVEIVDRVGAGDSFSGGFIYGCLIAQSLEVALKMGVAYSAIKHSVPGDLNWATRAEMEAVMKGGGLRVAR